jgi:hypothetical protein
MPVTLGQQGFWCTLFDQDYSVSRQCELLDLARSSWYYKPVSLDPYELHLISHASNGQLSTGRVCTPDRELVQAIGIQ